MASWLQSRLRAAEGLLEAVDRTAKTTREQQGGTVKLEGLFGLSGGGNSHGDGAPSSAEPQSYLQPNGQSPGENGLSVRTKPSRQGASPLTSKKMKPETPKAEKKTTKTTGRLSRTSSAASNKANTPLLSTPQGADPFLKEPGASTALPTSAATEALDTIPKVSVKRSSASSSEAPAPQSRRSSIDLPTPAPPLARHVEARQINQVPNPVEETRPPTAGEAAAVPLPAAVPLRLPVATPDSQVLGGVSKSHSQIQSPFEAKAHEKFADEQNLPPTSSDGGAFIHEAAGDGGQQGVMVSGGGEDEMQIGSDSEEQQEKQADGDGLAGDLHCSTSEMQEMAASGDSNENRGAHASNSAASAGRRVSVPSEGSSSSLQRIGIADGSRKIEGAAALHHELVEARELAKVIDTSGTSREARLQRVCDKLRARLEELKEENVQLEELLHQADARANGGAGEADRLQAELRRAEMEHARVMAAVEAKLKAKEEELDEQKTQADKYRTEMEVLENELANLQETSDNLLRERQSHEGRIVTALRDELAAMEERLEEERAAHSLSRKVAASRQEQLESDLSGSAAALTSLQRSLDDRNAKIEELYTHIHMIEDELEQVQSSLRRSEETAAREKARADANRSDVLEAQVEAWQAEAEKARKALHNLEDELETSRREQDRLTKQVKELEAVAQNVRGAADIDLVRRFQEVTDLLYLKQTQLEKMASEKAAQQLSLEREVSALRDELDKARRRASTVRDPMEVYGTEMTPMETMGDVYHRLANHAQVGAAVKGFVKAVDVTAANAMRVMREYPLARVIFFLYSIFIHLFVYILIQRLQNRLLLADESGNDPGMP